jgi:hypothetical protein
MMPDIDTPFGKIVVGQVMETRYLVGAVAYGTEKEARDELRRQALGRDLVNFALWVVALQGEIPQANEKEVLPILKKVRESGLDFAAMTAALGGQGGA